MHLLNFSQIYVHINVELHVVISEKECFIEYEHGYVYITKRRYVIRIYYLLCETLVEHPTIGRVKVRSVGSNNNIRHRSEAKGTGILRILY